MDYKELTNRLVCAGRIEKYYDGDSSGLYTRAATAITALLARAEEAEARAEKAEKEKDAAVKDLKSVVMGTIHACDYCKKNDPENFQCKRDDLCGCSEWEWNGGKKEE